MDKWEKLKEKITGYYNFVTQRFEEDHHDFDAGVLTGLQVVEQYMFDLDIEER
jgi:hypothetical protein